MRDPKERLRDILEAIAAIERHAAGGGIAESLTNMGYPVGDGAQR